MSDKSFKNKRDLSNVPGQFKQDPKHDYYTDFGFPDYLHFYDYYKRYCRNGVAFAGVEETVSKTWEDNPTFKVDPDADELTQEEKDIQKHLAKIRFWQCLAEVDRRSLVGDYAGVIFRFADNKQMDEPVDTVPGGLLGLVEVIPAWEEQLHVTSFNSDQSSPDYGKPDQFHFNESMIKTNQKQPRSFPVHPDRVLIWSKSGDVHGVSPLSPGYNDLITIEKVVGAGGEGFWKTAKNSLVLEMAPDTQLQQLATAMGVQPQEIADLIEDQVTNFNRGFDGSLVTQGLNTKTLPVNLPQPEQFFSIALQSFAASMRIPVKILLGMITGERASTEDAKGWAQTCMSRRTNLVIPSILTIADMFRQHRIFSDQDWNLKWSDLTESSMSDKIERADKMADINQKNINAGSTELVFTEDEIREAVDKPPLSDADRDSIDTDDEDEDDNDEE